MNLLIRNSMSRTNAMIRLLVCEVCQSLVVITGCAFGVAHIYATDVERIPPVPRLEPNISDPLHNQPNSIADHLPNVMVS